MLLPINFKRPVYIFLLLVSCFLTSEVAAQSGNQVSYLVVGSFASKKNAVNFSKSLNSPAKITYNENSGIYYVYTHTASSKNHLAHLLSDVKKTPGMEDAWIYDGEVRIGSLKLQHAKKSYVVAGKFKNKVNAAILSETLGIKGINANVIYIRDRGLYYVYTLVSGNQSELSEELQKIRRISGLQNAWIYNGMQNPQKQQVELGYVVAGSFGSKVNAAILAEALRIKGIDGQIIYIPEQKQYYVYTHTSNNEDDLTTALYQVKSVPGLQGSWIYNRGPKKKSKSSQNKSGKYKNPAQKVAHKGTPAEVQKIRYIIKPEPDESNGHVIIKGASEVVEGTTSFYRQSGRYRYGNSFGEVKVDGTSLDPNFCLSIV